MKVKNRATVSALRFREAIKCAVDACDCTVEAIAQRCGITRQAISYILKGRCKARKGTARAIADAVIAELRIEINNERERVEMLEQLADNINNTYDREYGMEE